ncbi:MAG: TonB-dependent receptor, partial [Proteobacteria bacterium]|nr:TonB-dependent receptor [Pseudomonadota bacterium]
MSKALPEWIAGPRRAFPAILMLTSALCASAVAQQPAAEGSAVLEAVIVTAQKRSESLQSVPVSVTALSSAQLAQTKLDSPADLAAQIPNMQQQGVIGEGTPLFALRGVSMFDYSPSQSTPVGSYMDEVYKGSFVLLGVEMYDLERIEVLRGPQGTLYGKNTTGGAINFIAKKPGFDTEGDIKLGIGNYNRREVEGAFQTGLIPDRLAVRMAFTYTKADGFVHNVLPGHPDLEGLNQYGLRFSASFKATEDLNFLLRYSRSEQNPQNYAIIAGSVA